jgi:hypothetical protein
MTETLDRSPALGHDIPLEGFEETRMDEGLPPAPQGMIATFHELLQHPAWLAARTLRGEGAAMRIATLLLGAALCAAIYGLSLGFFDSGWLFLVTAVKVPLILFGSLLLCLPSLYVFGTLSGARFTPERFLLSVAAFAGLLGLVLLGFFPIAWLFAVSSRSVGAVAFLNLIIWMVTVSFAGYLLRRFLRAFGGRDGTMLWVILFVFVSFQMTTYLRPVVGWEPGEALFVSEKMWFLEHMGRSWTLPD